MNQTVLICDDTMFMRTVIAQAMEAAGCEVVAQAEQAPKPSVLVSGEGHTDSHLLVGVTDDEIKLRNTGTSVEKL